MKYGKTIPIDLSARGAGKIIGEAAVSGDSLYRVLTFALEEEGKPWPVPADVRAALAFRTDWGGEGEYDTMPDGSDAARIEGNLVTVSLVDAILARAGSVTLSLVLRDQRMGRLSSHPMVMTVSQGLGDVPGMDVRYYRVGNLEEINTVLEDLTERMDAVDTEENRCAAQEAREAAQAAKDYAASVDPSELNRRIGEKGDDVCIQDGKLFLTSQGQQIGNGTELPDGGGLAFDGGYVDEGNRLHLTMEGTDIDGFLPIDLPAVGNGGDSGSRMTVAMKTANSVVAAQSDEEVMLEFGFTSVDAVTQTPTGDGTMEITVGGVVKRTASIAQGDVQVNLRPWLSAGANSVVLTVTDAYGGSAVRRLTVTLESLSLSWNLGQTEKTDSTLTVYLTPVGNGVKTVHLQVDEEDFEVFEVSTSGRRVSKVIPVQLHGGHAVTAWAEMDAAGTHMTSEVLTCAVAWVTDAELPVICCAQIPGEQSQFSTVQIVHRVVDPLNNPANVRYLVDGTLFREAEVDQSEQVWTYRLNEAQDTTLSILCGDVRRDVTLHVEPLDVQVQEVTDGQKLKVDPAVMASLQDWSDGGYRFTLSEGFDLVNGGLQNDEQGIRCIRVTAGDRLTLDYPMFAQDARAKGMAAKIVYAVRGSSAKHCTAISCQQGGMGLEIQANNVYLRGNQTECKLSVCEDEKVELDMNIQPDSGDGIMFLWEKCSSFAYMKYAADESFTHTQQCGITIGCDDADVYIYLMRFYDRDLTDAERMANFAADGADSNDILARQNRNDIYDSTGSIDIEKCASRNPDCHHIVISAQRMSHGKSDEVRGTIRHIFRSGGPEHQWRANVSMFVQGTSSVEHAGTAGPNLNFYYPEGITLDNGTVVTDGYAMNGRDKSIPVLELTYKKNIASQDHIVNRATAEWYNRYQPSIRPERAENPLLRDCLDSCMCAVYFQNTGSDAVQVGPDLVPPGATVFFGLGNLCSNKDSAAAFGYHPIVIEVKNNTEPQVRFKSDDLTGENWGNNYEFRYLDTTRFTEEQAKAEWQKVQTFLYETDVNGATDALLTPAVTIGGETYFRDDSNYRRTRWLAEASAIFDKKTLTWHHNITLFLLLRDNRAKNMFWSYDPAEKKWGLWFNWDNDTGLCRNNDGYVDIEPGYMDFDTLGTGDVFNGADNALFCNLREWEFDNLKADYLDRESAGAWDIDRFYQYAMESQEAVCEALWVEDAAHNAIRIMQNLGTTAYLERATGRLRLHIKKALIFQKVLVDSYYCSAAATGQSSAFRGYTPDTWGGVEPNGRVSVTTYTNMYVNILAGNTHYRVRASEGIPVEMDISASLNNTEIYFRHAPWIQDLGDLSGLYLGQFEASTMSRIRRLIIGSENPDYSNTNFTQASFDNCLKLETLNLGGLKNAKRSFDFRPNIYLKDLYTRGSGVTGLTFAKEGRLEQARLNAVKSLAADTLTKLHTFEMPSYSELTALSVEDTPMLDTQAMADGAGKLERVRLIGIDWKCENADTLMRLTRCAGRDDEGRDIPEPVVTGSAHVNVITQEELGTLQTVFPELELSYSEVVNSHVVTFRNWDGTVLCTVRVRHEETVPNPITTGLISRPERPSDVEYYYNYAGWDTSLESIMWDRDITAVYAPSDRYYVVRYWYDDAENSLAQEFRVIAHGSCAFTGTEPGDGEGIWMGWDADSSDVVSDMNIHAVYILPRVPDSVPVSFDYLYSDDPNDNSAYSLEEFMGVLQQGLERTYFQIGDRIKFTVPENDLFTDREFVMVLRSFKHFRKWGEEEFAGPYFGMLGVTNAGKQMNGSNSNDGGFAGCKMLTYLTDVVYPQLPLYLRRLIVPIEVLTTKGKMSADLVAARAYLTFESAAEVGLEMVEPYLSEVAEGADEVCFSCYTDKTSRIKYFLNGTGAKSPYWTRSPGWNNSNGYIAIDGGGTRYGGTNGVVSASTVSDLRLCFGFCLGVAAE